MAATLHAIIIANTTDNNLHAEVNRNNLQQLVANISTATGLKLEETVIDGNSGLTLHSGYEKVQNALAKLTVTADEDLVIFYYAGHGVNTGTGSGWPALAVEGKETSLDRLIELSSIKKTLQKKKPRFLIVLADTCNDFLPEPPPTTRSRKMLGEEPANKTAYNKLFLGYTGSFVAVSSGPGQNSFSNESGGLFTQKLLASLNQELQSGSPNWKRIADQVKQPILVNRPDQDHQNAQVKNETVPDSVSANNEEGENHSLGVVPPYQGNDNFVSEGLPQPQICGPQAPSGGGGCNQDADGKKWNVFVEEKLWFNRWQGWYPNRTSGGGHYVSVTSEDKLTSIVTVGFRYDKVSAALTILPEQSYTRPVVSVDNVKVNSSPSEREEIDATVSYSILPELQVGIGFKRITPNFPVHETLNGAVVNEFSWHYKISGPTLNIGGQICLANLLGADISMFGTFSYGSLKTSWWKDASSNEQSKDYSSYFSTDLGLSWGLPKLSELTSKLPQVRPELRLGFRAQTIYTEASLGHAVDSADGFTLGLRLVY
jgi:hypothetical protein